MKKLLIAAALLVGLAGAATAQTAPAKTHATSTTTVKHSRKHTKMSHKHKGKHGAHHHKKTSAAVK